MNVLRYTVEKVGWGRWDMWSYLCSCFCMNIWDNAPLVRFLSIIPI